MANVIIPKENLLNHRWLDNLTYWAEFIPPKQLKDKYELDVSDVLYAEYWDDDNSYHYYISCDDDTIIVQNEILCEENNQLIMEIIKEN